jgi:DNA-binding NtrC family response regulator
MSKVLYKETTLDPDRPLFTAPREGGSGRLLAIYDIGRRLIEQREPRELADTILQAIVDHLRPDHACVLALDPDGSCRALACHRLDSTRPVDDWPLSRTVLRRVRESGLAVLAYDSLADARFATVESVQRLGIRSVMCVPLVARGERGRGRGASGRAEPVRGLVYVDNRLKHSYTPEDLDFLNAVSLYASRLLERAEEHARTSEALRLTDERLSLLQGELLRHRIVGCSPGLLGAYDTLCRLARAGARVLLRGETGTGKELFARAYAANSPRAGQPYVPLPIPTLAPTLVESELFGHVKGAFTEATRDRKGRLELADQGILFLDEVGDIDLAVQPKLLRFLDSGELVRVGDAETRTVDALVVSASNRPLEKDVAEGRFRADLLARLGHDVTIPPLRERADDIPLLVDHFLTLYDRGPKKKTFSEEAMQLLFRHRWPFNVRELQQVVERAVCVVDHDVILPKDLPDYLRLTASAAAPAEAAASAEAPVAPDVRPALSASTFPPLKEVVENVERDHIVRALEVAGGSKRRAIELLGISSETFYRRLDEFGLRNKLP